MLRLDGNIETHVMTVIFYRYFNKLAKRFVVVLRLIYLASFDWFGSLSVNEKIYCIHIYQNMQNENLHVPKKRNFLLLERFINFKRFW